MPTKSPFATVVAAALEEARRRGNRRLGTEDLLLGLLHVPGSPSVRALGVDLETARAALGALDDAALRAIGLDVERPPESAPRRHPPVPLNAVTSSARAVLHHAVEPTTRKTRGSAPEHLLRALLDCAPPDPVAELLAQLDLDRDAVRARLA